jgi:hypothetical protein
MADASRPPLPVSRRTFLIAASAAPALHSAAGGAQGVAELAKAWNADRDLIALLARRWSDLETALQRRTSSLDFNAAAAAGDAGACEMIAIDSRLPALFDSAEAAADHIARLPCRTVSDALAKLQVGIRIVGPEDTDPTAWTLLHEGYEDLADFLGPLADG